jgi:hypothetical protein
MFVADWHLVLQPISPCSCVVRPVFDALIISLPCHPGPWPCSHSPRSAVCGGKRDKHSLTSFVHSRTLFFTPTELAGINPTWPVYPG